LPLLKFLIAWANAPFTVVLGTVGLFALLQASGLLGLLGGGDHGGDGGDDVDGDGHDVEGHEAAHEDASGAEHESDHDPDTDAESEERANVAHAILAPLGIGKLPFSLVWQIYGAVFALTGLVANAHYVESSSGPPIWSLAWTMPLALGVGYAAVAGLARLLRPIVADENANATTRAELVGQMGVVISRRVDEAFGEVRFRDKTGHDVRLVVNLAPGHEAAREGEKVVVVDHDDGRLYVARLDEALEEEEGKETNVRS
jgi:membrane protein implicated in regulation of membrane protease activity